MEAVPRCGGAERTVRTNGLGVTQPLIRIPNCARSARPFATPRRLRPCRRRGRRCGTTAAEKAGLLWPFHLPVFSFEDKTQPQRGATLGRPDSQSDLAALPLEPFFDDEPSDAFHESLQLGRGLPKSGSVGTGQQPQERSAAPGDAEEKPRDVSITGGPEERLKRLFGFAQPDVGPGLLGEKPRGRTKRSDRVCWRGWDRSRWRNRNGASQGVPQPLLVCTKPIELSGDGPEALGLTAEAEQFRGGALSRGALGVRSGGSQLIVRGRQPGDLLAGSEQICVLDKGAKLS